MSRFNTNVEALIARRAIDSTSRTVTIVAIAESSPQDVSSFTVQEVTRENVTAAESAVRDVNFAIEASRLTRAQILASSCFGLRKNID